MNDIITVNGSIPAYVYYFINSLIKDAVNRGIDKDTAKSLVIQTFIGSSALLQNSENSIEQEINSVCSKKGTTIEAINTLIDKNIDDIIHQANENCINRAKAIGK